MTRSARCFSSHTTMCRSVCVLALVYAGAMAGFGENLINFLGGSYNNAPAETNGINNAVSRYNKKV